ncbi:LCP family protein [Streptomyces sp. H27-C3]|uniref:LCP family protein n=1 Tax=Streptomyces sp. H27-C3 TaxID=3046305 RepID=UPI0024BA538A|nr:LCP family protein [Streptomyces sp. H27-C3]MDJ0460359.1 LCP family protein [Streptomyces sp. H27-C3]
MDADVTDSAGTPSGPDTPAEDEAKNEASEGRNEETGTGTSTDSGADTSMAPDTTEAPDAGATADNTAATGAADNTTDDKTGGAGDDSDRAAASTDAAPAANRKRHWLRWTGVGASFVLLVAAGVGWWLYKKLDGNITTDTTAAAELETYEKERPTPVALDAQNILLIGSDTRSGKGNSKYGQDEGSERSDTTILLHLAADRQSATAVSLPRDLMVEIPSCRRTDGTRSEEQFAQFNWAFEFGGTACTIRTVERLTGVRLDHHMVVDFDGFKGMVDAVDGVEICLSKPIDDKDAHLKLGKGLQTLNGEEALGYVRARKSIGDGSDTERMDRQQQFLGALVNKVQSNGVLLNPTMLYPVLDAATKSLTTDPGLDSLKDLYNLVRGMRNIPTEKVQFMTVPRQPYSYDQNRDELVEPDAGRLFKQLREDAPVSVVPAGTEKEEPAADTSSETEEESDSSTDEESDSSTDEKPDDAGAQSPTPTPTFTGTNAATEKCE